MLYQKTSTFYYLLNNPNKNKRVWCKCGAKIINQNPPYITPHSVSGYFTDYQIYYSTNFESFKQFKINA